MSTQTQPKTTDEPRPQRRTVRRASGRSTSAAFHAVVEERLRSLEKQLDEVKGRVNGLIFLIVGVVITQVVLGLVH
ncbi:MAG TPA: hypothetical protein VM013_04860 [Dehalococcoidia bacterium]|nr:hypothetical protein [Dehalococcoidia bacterium]